MEGRKKKGQAEGEYKYETLRFQILVGQLYLIIFLKKTIALDDNLMMVTPFSNSSMQSITE